MNILQSLFTQRSSAQMSELVADVVHRSCPVVWSRVQHRALAMRSAEARGYIRARAADVLQVEAEATLRRHGRYAPNICQRLVEQASESLVRSLHKEIIRSQATAVTHRRAA